MPKEIITDPVTVELLDQMMDEDELEKGELNMFILNGQSHLLLHLTAAPEVEMSLKYKK